MPKELVPLIAGFRGLNRVTAPHLLGPGESPDTTDTDHYLDQVGIVGPRRGRFKRYTADAAILGYVPLNFTNGRFRIVAMANGVWRAEGDIQVRASAARVYNSGNQSIDNATETTLSFNAERYDSDLFHDLSTNPERFTIAKAGIYRIGACVQWASSSPGDRAVRLRLNGSTYIAGVGASGIAYSLQFMNVETEYRFAAGDYIEVRVVQDSGGALNVLAAANQSPEFWISYIGS